MSLIFKKEKEVVLEDVKWRVYNRVENMLQNYTYNGQITLDKLMEAIKYSISEGVTEGLNAMLENQYTEDDFERDLTLKP